MKGIYMKLKQAFTLAEVLITMSIIGVVTALTIPNLVKNYQKDAQAIQIQKMSNDIANAIDMFITEEGKTKFYLTSAYTNTLPNGDAVTDGLDNFITTHFKVAKTCTAKTSGGCFSADKYGNISNTSTDTDDDEETEETEDADNTVNANGEFACPNKAYVLANGAAICFIKGTGTNPNLTLYVDTNGIEKPNIGGRDMFSLVIDSATGNVVGTTGGCTDKVYGDGCYALLSGNSWKMDY